MDNVSTNKAGIQYIKNLETVIAEQKDANHEAYEEKVALLERLNILNIRLAVTEGLMSDAEIALAAFNRLIAGLNQNASTK